MHRILLLPLAGTALALLAACGGGGNDEAGASWRSPLPPSRSARPS